MAGPFEGRVALITGAAIVADGGLTAHTGIPPPRE